VQSNPAYLTIILLSRVVTRLGSAGEHKSQDSGGLFASDIAYLQELYRQINGDGKLHIKARCPRCEQRGSKVAYKPGHDG